MVLLLSSPTLNAPEPKSWRAKTMTIGGKHAYSNDPVVTPCKHRISCPRAEALPAPLQVLLLPCRLPQLARSDLLVFLVLPLLLTLPLLAGLAQMAERA